MHLVDGCNTTIQTFTIQNNIVIEICVSALLQQVLRVGSRTSNQEDVGSTPRALLVQQP